MRLILALALAALAGGTAQAQDSRSNIFTLIPRTGTGSGPAGVGELRFRDDQSASHYIGFKAPATVGANLVWELPAADSAGFFTSDGAGHIAIGTTGASMTVGIIPHVMILRGTAAEIDGSGLGAALQIQGSTTSNGNIVFNPGNVAGAAGVFVNAARLDWPALIIKNASGTTTAHVFEIQDSSGTPVVTINGSNPGAGLGPSVMSLGVDPSALGLVGPSLIVQDVVGSMSAASNASGITMAATPSSGGADISVFNTGTGTLLPLRFWRNPNEVARFDTSNRFLLGMTASDVSTGLGSMIVADSIISASAATNASVGSFAAIAGSFVAVSSSKTGSGTFLPLTFFTGGAESARFDTSNRFLLGITSSDVSAGVGTVIASGPLISATAAANASVGSFAAIGGSYIALSSSKTGSGTFLPLTFWTGGAQRVTIDPSTGFAGFGTTSPTSGLHVKSAAQPTALVETTSAASNVLGFQDGAGHVWFIGQGLTGTTAGDFTIYDATAGHSRLAIPTSGLVLINENADDGTGLQFQVSGAISSSGGYYSASSASNALNIPNGGVLALNGTFGSIGNYLVLQGTGPEINGSGLGTALQIQGSTSSNGNIVLNPGNVAANASVIVNAARLDQPAVIITNTSGTTTANILEIRDSSGTPVVRINGSNPGAGLRPSVMSLGVDPSALGLVGPSLIVQDVLGSMSSATNASLVTMAATPSSGGADISVSATGTGTLLPLRFFRNPNEIARFDTSNRFLLGMTASDVSTGLGSMIVADSLISATAATNASVGSFAAIAGSFVAVSSSKTGSGTFLPLAFFTGGAESARFDTSNRFLLGITSSDVSAGAGTVIASGSLVSASATTNASVGSFAAIGGSYIALSSSKTGTGTFLPLAFFTSGSENARFDTGNRFLLGITSSDVSGGVGNVIASGSLISATAATNASVGSFAAIGGSYVALSSSKTGTGSFLPLTFFTSGVENARFDTSNRFLLGLTSSDVSAGLGTVIASGPLISASATTNASVGSFAAIAGSFVAVSSSKTGSGTFLPLAFFTGGAESARILANGQALIGRTTDDGTGALLEVNGAISVGSCTGCGGVTALTAGTGISLSASTGAVTITNAGVTSLSGTSNQIIASTSTGAITLSTPQNIDTAAAVAFKSSALSGSGQTTASFDTGASLDGSVVLDGTSTSAGSGGAVVFSADARAWKYAAIKGFATDGANNTRGDVVFSTRRVSTDSTLTETMRVKFDGSVVMAGDALIAGKTLMGLTSSDVSVGTGGLILADALVSATAAANASVGSFSAIASSYIALSSSKSGSGTYLPMAFFTSGSERSRILTTGQELFGITSTDASTNAGALISADAFVSVTAASNASTASFAAVASTYAAVSSSRTGSGTFLPMAFFTNGAERARILTNGDLLINHSSDDGSGAVLQVSGAINATSPYKISGSSGATLTVTVRNSAGTGSCTLTFTGGIFISTTC